MRCIFISDMDLKRYERFPLVVEWIEYAKELLVEHGGQDHLGLRIDTSDNHARRGIEFRIRFEEISFMVSWYEAGQLFSFVKSGTPVRYESID